MRNPQQKQPRQTRRIHLQKSDLGLSVKLVLKQFGACPHVSQVEGYGELRKVYVLYTNSTFQDSEWNVCGTT